MAAQYLVVIEKGKRNYSAYSPDLPGCIATGKTVEETERRMREAMEFHVEGLVRHNLPVPQPQAVARYAVVRDSSPDCYPAPEVQLPPRLSCLRCGHSWLPRQPRIRICPKCKSPYFDRPRHSDRRQAAS